MTGAPDLVSTFRTRGMEYVAASATPQAETTAPDYGDTPTTNGDTPVFTFLLRSAPVRRPSAFGLRPRLPAARAALVKLAHHPRAPFLKNRHFLDKRVKLMFIVCSRGGEGRSGRFGRGSRSNSAISH